MEPESATVPRDCGSEMWECGDGPSEGQLCMLEAFERCEPANLALEYEPGEGQSYFSVVRRGDACTVVVDSVTPSGDDDDRSERRECETLVEVGGNCPGFTTRNCEDL